MHGDCEGEEESRLLLRDGPPCVGIALTNLPGCIPKGAVQATLLKFLSGLQNWQSGSF